MAFAYAVALTGSIATGKSTVAEIFKNFGFSIIDADVIAHAILDRQYLAISKSFGTEVLKGKHINRKALGRVVFEDSKKRKQLESLLHPLIYDEIIRLSSIEERHQKPYFVDIPLFFETNHYPIEKSLVIYTPKNLQCQRLMKRNGLSRKEALSRIAIQLDIEKKKEKATYIIDNSKDRVHLQEECDRMKEVILGDFQ